MLTGEAVKEMRNKTNDRDEIGLDDEELLSYLNEAIQYISAYLIGMNSPEMVKDILITEQETDVPHNFVRTAGTFPVKITGGKIKTFSETPNFTLRYFASKDIYKIDVPMPFIQDALNQIAIKLGCIYVNAQEQLDISQDNSILQEINAAIANAVIGTK